MRLKLSKTLIIAKPFDIVQLSTYKEVIGNLSPLISNDISHLSIDNFLVGTYRDIERFYAPAG